MKRLNKFIRKLLLSFIFAIWFIIRLIANIAKWLCIFIVAVLCAAKLSFEAPGVLPGISPPRPIVATKQIHPIIPHTRWSQLRACGAYFDEQKAFEEARQCTNTAPMFKSHQMSSSMVPPRCYVITTDSPDVTQEKYFNGILMFDIFSGGVGAVMGFYDEDTKTVYIVENVDSRKIYLHELQHYYQDVAGMQVNHLGDVWNVCQPQYYTPSQTTIKVHQLIDNLEK